MKKKFDEDEEIILEMENKIWIIYIVSDKEFYNYIWDLEIWIFHWKPTKIAAT